MGRDEEFAEYVGARWPRLVRTAVLLGCSPAEAEDVVQSALLRCLLHWSKVLAADDRDAYVHRVLINTFTSARRRRWTRESPVARLPEEVSADPTVSVDLSDAVLRSLGRLNAEQRATVVLRYYSQLTEHQTADILGIAVGTVKSRVARALVILADDPDLNALRGAR